jgi:hypothetical protein
MSRVLSLVIFVLALALGGVVAALPAAPPTAADTPELGLVPADDGCAAAETLSTDRQAGDRACTDLYCEWRPKCYNEPGGWSTTYKEKWCFTNCGYFFYYTGQNCCYTTQPGSC